METQVESGRMPTEWDAFVRHATEKIRSMYGDTVADDVEASLLEQRAAAMESLTHELAAAERRLDALKRVAAEMQQSGLGTGEPHSHPDDLDLRSRRARTTWGDPGPHVVDLRAGWSRPRPVETEIIDAR